MRRDVDPVLLRVVQNLLDSVAEEMGSALERTGFSPNIKERRDYSCALFDRGGEMIAHAAHIPVHLGSTPLSVRAALDAHRFRAGDVMLLNDPYRGGTHLPDLTVVAGVFETDAVEPTFYVANRAHHADVGGAVRGSMALFEEIYQEGLRIPPLLLVDRGAARRDVEDLVLANMRQPEERRGDFRAQLGALEVGRRRLLELLDGGDRAELLTYGDHLKDAAEDHVRTLFEAIPDGQYRAVDHLDGDGLTSGPIPIAVEARVSGDRCHFDFAGTGPQTAGCVNANRAVTLSAVFYVVRALAGSDIPANAGCLRPVELTIPAGSLLDPQPPAAVAGGNTETSQRIVDVLLQAFAPALPERVPAASQGTMNNLTLGAPGAGGFSYYETVGGGTGAGPWGAGASGVHSHMTNTRNTPVEALEHALPVRVVEYSIRRGSGGQGRHRGGDGIVRELELLAPAEAAILSERREIAPPGAAGGRAGQRGRNTLKSARTEGALPTGEHLLPGKWQGALRPGDRLRLETPGGGGWGEAPSSPADPIGSSSGEGAPP